MYKKEKLKAVGVVMAIAIVMKLKKNEKYKNQISKRLRRREWLHRRYFGNDLTHIAMRELQLEDPKSFINFCRLSKEAFENLLSLVGPVIRKQNTVMRESVSPTTRLLITLRFLASGNSYNNLSSCFQVSAATICKFVPETLKAIYKALRLKYLKPCTTASEWKRVADDFYNKWNFPMCLGAIDGKHIAFRPKSEDGSYYSNYKGFNSVILMAVVDANYKFIMVDIGVNGRANDAEAFNVSDIGHSIKQNLLDFPEDEELPGTNVKVPYVFVTDDAFSLTPRIIKPYSQRQLMENSIFNYRLSRAQQVVENAFGILCERFPIFQREINLPVDTVELITLACCALHNLLTKDNEDEYTSDNKYLIGIERCVENTYSNGSSEIKNNYRNFFNNINVLPCQNEAIKQEHCYES